MFVIIRNTFDWVILIDKNVFHPTTVSVCKDRRRIQNCVIVMSTEYISEKQFDVGI